MIDIEFYLTMALEKLADTLNSRVHEAIKYALLAGGKKVRSKLCLLTCEVEKGAFEFAIAPACALEMIHTYSLIHDDLPAMDNDDFRRGKLTTHKVFGEAIAILAGDALLTDAFLLLSDRTLLSSNLSADQRLDMVQILAHASGSGGMILGQNYDVENMQNDTYTWEDLKSMHRLKTGQLFAASLALGGIAAGSSRERCEVLAKAGELLGLAFQIADDLIDSLENTGKTPGKDLVQRKLTILRIMSAAEARKTLYSLTEESVALIAAPDSKLVNFIYTLLDRNF